MCKHEAFECASKVARLEDTGKFMLEVRLVCSQCQMPFQFLGVEPGLKMNGAAVSVDGQELNIAVAPNDSAPSPLQRMMGNGDQFNA